VDTAAGDVLRLLGRLKLFPEQLIGHSFGGKVVMSMAEQFGRRGSRLPRPVKVRLIDSLCFVSWRAGHGHISRAIPT